MFCLFDLIPVSVCTPHVVDVYFGARLSLYLQCLKSVWLHRGSASCLGQNRNHDYLFVFPRQRYFILDYFLPFCTLSTSDGSQRVRQTSSVRWSSPRPRSSCHRKPSGATQKQEEGMRRLVGGVRGLARQLTAIIRIMLLLLHVVSNKCAVPS